MLQNSRFFCIFLQSKTLTKMKIIQHIRFLLNKFYLFFNSKNVLISLKVSPFSLIVSNNCEPAKSNYQFATAKPSAKRNNNYGCQHKFTFAIIVLLMSGNNVLGQQHAPDEPIHFLTVKQSHICTCDEEAPCCMKDEKNPLTGKLPNFTKKYKLDYKLKVSGNDYKLNCRHSPTNVVNYSVQPKFCYASDRVWYLQKTNLGDVYWLHC